MTDKNDQNRDQNRDHIDDLVDQHLEGAVGQGDFRLRTAHLPEDQRALTWQRLQQRISDGDVQTEEINGQAGDRFVRDED